MNNEGTKDVDYKFKLSMVESNMSTGKWWQEMSSQQQLDFAKQTAEDEYAAEVQIAAEFNRTPEPIEQKIKRFISKYDSLAKKYPL